MPVPSVRYCLVCSHRWFTAIVAACACPACLEIVPEPAAWLHVCSDGHSAQAGGECAECAQVVERTEAPRPIREWRNR